LIVPDFVPAVPEQHEHAAPRMSQMWRSVSCTVGFMSSSDPSPSTPIARFNDDLTTMTVRGFVVGYYADDGHVIYSTQDKAGTNQLNKFGLNFDWILWFAGHTQSLIVRSGLGGFFLNSIFGVIGYFVPESKPSLALCKELFADPGQQYSEDFEANKAKPKSPFQAITFSITWFLIRKKRASRTDLSNGNTRLRKSNSVQRAVSYILTTGKEG